MILFIGSLMSVCVSSCDDDSNDIDNNPPVTDCATIPKTFSDAHQIIQTTCATTVTCHDNGSSRGPGPLVTYEQIFAAKNDIRSAVQNGSMPRNRTLTSAQKASIICWIDSGAPQN